MSLREKLPPVRAVVFDFDGTLAETNIDFNEMRSRLRDLYVSEGCWDETYYQRYILELIQGVCATQPPERADTLRVRSMEVVAGVEREACTGSAPYAGVPEALAELESRGYRMGIFTRNSRSGCELVLERHPLPHSVLFAREDVENVKPHPEHLERTLAALNCPPELAVVVGDHETDVQSARDVGAYAVGLLTTSGTRERFLEVGAHLVLSSAAELPDCLADVPA